MLNTIKVKLYGAQRCRKTRYYQAFLENQNLDYQFLDVEENENYAEELKGLYQNRKLNFPTLTINTKKLRNPTDTELLQWLTNNK